MSDSPLSISDMNQYVGYDHFASSRRSTPIHVPTILEKLDYLTSNQSPSPYQSDRNDKEAIIVALKVNKFDIFMQFFNNHNNIPFLNTG